jgi:hypothetical protein
MMLTLTKKTYEDLQTIEVYKDGTLVGQRAKLNFLNFADISDDETNQRINLNLGSFMKYNFGDGSDGDLIISTGTTTIDLGNNKVFIKKYRNLKITGNANLVFSNPHNDGTLIVFLVKGDCELTSNASNTIDLRNLGGLGGSGANHGSGFFDIMKGRVYNVFVRNISLNQGTGGASSINEPPNSDFAFSTYSVTDSNMNTYSASGGRGGGGLLIMVGGNLTVSSAFTINASEVLGVLILEQHLQVEPAPRDMLLDLLHDLLIKHFLILSQKNFYHCLEQEEAEHICGKVRELYKEAVEQVEVF